MPEALIRLHKKKKTSLLMAELIVATLALVLILTIATSSVQDVKAAQKERKIPPGHKADDGCYISCGIVETPGDGWAVQCDAVCPDPPVVPCGDACGTPLPPPPPPPPTVAGDTSSSDSVDIHGGSSGSGSIDVNGGSSGSGSSSDSGSDHISSDSGSDHISSDSGSDHISSDSGSDHISGGSHNKGGDSSSGS
jgi:uncharacterized membrane protein YgcG